MDDDSARLKKVAFESGHQLLGQEEGYIVGARGQMVMRLATEAPIVTIGKPGAGKGVASAIPNLLDHPGSVVSLEIGGVTFHESINYRRDTLKQKIIVFDPLNATGYHNAYYNPLDDLPGDGRHPEFWSQAVGLARTIAKTAEGEKENQVYFQENAVGFLAAAMMYIKMARDDRYPPNLVTISKIFSSYPSKKVWQPFVQGMRDWIGPQRDLINQYGNRFSKDETDNNKEDNKSDNDVVTSTSLWLRFISDDTLAECMTKSNVSFRNLRDEKTTIYIVMKNPENFQIYHSWLRFILESIINLTPNPGTGGADIEQKDRILMVLDEMTHLGKLDAVMTGAQTARQKGITLWGMFQSMGDLIHVYGREKAFSFISAAECVQVYQTTEPETLDYLVKKIGRDLFYVPSASHAIMDGTSKTENISRSNAYGESDSVAVNESEAETDTVGHTEGKSENKTTGKSHGVGTTETDTVTHNRTTGDTIGTTVTEGANSSFTINHSFTSGSQWNSGLDSHSHGGSSSASDGSSSTFGRNHSTANSHSRSTSESVGNSHATGRTVNDTFQESVAMGISMSEQVSKARQRTKGNTKTAGTSKTVTEQNGEASAVNNSLTYTVSYAPQILPAVEWRDIENMLTEERQILLVNNKNMSLRLLDYQARFFRIPFLKMRAEGPALLPPPDYRPDYLSMDLQHINLVPESEYAFAALPAAKLPQIKPLDSLHDIPVSIPDPNESGAARGQRQTTLRDITTRVTALTQQISHLDLEVQMQSSRAAQLNSEIANLSGDSDGLTKLKAADKLMLKFGLPAGLVISAATLGFGGGLWPAVALGLSGIAYTAVSVISRMVAEENLEERTARQAEELAYLRAKHVQDLALRDQARAELQQAQHDLGHVQRGVLAHAERGIAAMLTSHENIDDSLRQREATFNDRVQKAAKGLQAVCNGVAATNTLCDDLLRRQSAINDHISTIDEQKEKHRSVIGAWKMHAEYLLSYLDLRSRWYHYKNGHLPAPALGEIPSFGKPGAVQYEFSPRGVSLPLTPLADFDRALPQTLPISSFDFSPLRAAAAEIATAKRAGIPINGLIDKIQKTASLHTNSFGRDTAERARRLNGNAQKLNGAGQEIAKMGDTVNVKIDELGSSQNKLIGYVKKINSSTDALLGDIFGSLRAQMEEVRARFDEQTVQLERNGPRGRPVQRAENRLS